VALIDTYPLDGKAIRAILPKAINAVLGGHRAYASISDARWIAMGAYHRLFANISLTEIAAPTLLVRATEPMAEIDKDREWRSSWNFAYEVTDGAGDHFTMTTKYAASTAEAIDDWLCRRGL
jgi:thioesterase domain-containing protein